VFVPLKHKIACCNFNKDIKGSHPTNFILLLQKPIGWVRMTSFYQVERMG